jgi:hypothetical protein
MKKSEIQFPQVISAPFAEKGEKNVIPDAATGSYLASIEEGFPPITMLPKKQGGLPPDGKDFNGLGNLLSQFYFYTQNGNQYTFDPEVSSKIGGYPEGAKLWYTDSAGLVRYLKSLKDDNTDNFITNPEVIGPDGSWQDCIPSIDYIDDNFVKLTGNQTVKGVKTFCQSGGAQQQHLLIQNDKMTNSAPAQEQWVGVAMTDVRNSWKTALRHGLYPDGRSQSVWISKSLDDTYSSSIYHGWNASNQWLSNIVVTDNNRAQAITGRKTFNGSGIGIIKSGSAIDIQNPNVDLTSTSISGTTEIHFVDKNNKVQAIFEHQNMTSGQSVAIMAARNHANNGWVTVNVGFDANDVAYTATATPPADSNGSNIATTSWVRNYSKNYGAQLNYSGAITITGTGTKTASVSGVLIMTGKGSSAVGQFKITIGGQTFNCAQGYNGTDYYHATFAYFPVESGQSYTIEEISNSCDLRLIPYK